MNKIKFYLSGYIFLLSIMLLLVSCNQAPVTQETVQNKELETYEYIVTSIDSEGIHGQSVTDNTGIFIEHETLKDIELSVNDQISVSFPVNDYETITLVTKIN
jgi:hypothetical protein